MSAAVSHPLVAIEGLRAALDAVADAMVAARADDLLSVEPRLAAAVAALPADLSSDLSPADRDELREHLTEAYGALRRCRALGAALSAVIEPALSAHGLLGGYDRAGHELTPSARVGGLQARG